MCYYPTALALYGAEKLGIELDLNLPDINESYRELTWYYSDDNKLMKNLNFSAYWPYLGWASRHYGAKSNLYILGELYPLSYEKQDGSYRYNSNINKLISKDYYMQGVTVSHLWHASEMFLMLLSSNL